MAPITPSIIEMEKIINTFSLFRTRLLKYLSPEYLEIKNPSIRKEQIKMDVEFALSEFDKSLIQTDPDQLIVDEIKILKNSLHSDIITKNRNKSLNKNTAEAIETAMKYLSTELDIRSAALEDALFDISQEKKVKFDDVLIQVIELTIFIKLASRHGLISYNRISDTLRADCFSLLTNFSKNSLRNSLTGNPSKNQSLIEIDQDNIDNLKSILNKMLASLNSWTGNLNDLL